MVEDALGKCLLASFEDFDLLLDRADGDEFVNEDRLVLADPVRPVDRLILDGRVPPGIIEDHRVRGGEIETDAASLQADQKDRDLAVLEGEDLFFAIDRVARSEARFSIGTVSGHVACYAALMDEAWVGDRRNRE